MKSNKGRIVLTVFIVLTVAFIFTQSLLSREVSNEESEAVGDLLAHIIPPSTSIGAFVTENLRKIAHFVEFGVLGSELTMYALLYTEKKKISLALSQSASFVVAFFDETLQIFSGRGSEISDVWLDFFGALTFSIICFLIYMTVKFVFCGERSDIRG